MYSYKVVEVRERMMAGHSSAASQRRRQVRLGSLVSARAPGTAQHGRTSPRVSKLRTSPVREVGTYATTGHPGQVLLCR